MLDIVIATGNKGKLKEIRNILGELEINISGLDSFPDVKPAAETGSSFEENSALKAEYYAKHTNAMVLADDSGLEVDYLGGAPGVYSARFAGEHATDYMNNQKLLEMMEKVPLSHRSARFICSISIALPDKLIGSVTGSCDGYIALTPKGLGGFGYDPLFVVKDYNMTFAELSLDIKNKISHRAKALSKAFIMLENYLLQSHHIPSIKEVNLSKKSSSNHKERGGVK